MREYPNFVVDNSERPVNSFVNSSSWKGLNYLNTVCLSFVLVVSFTGHVTFSLRYFIVPVFKMLKQ